MQLRHPRVAQPGFAWKSIGDTSCSGWQDRCDRIFLGGWDVSCRSLPSKIWLSWFLRSRVLSLLGFIAKRCRCQWYSSGCPQYSSGGSMKKATSEKRKGPRIGDGEVRVYKVRVYPAECGEQLGRGPSNNGSSKSLVPKSFSGERTLWDKSLPVTLTLWDTPVLCTPPLPLSQKEFQNFLRQRFRDVPGLLPDLHLETPSCTEGCSQAWGDLRFAVASIGFGTIIVYMQ